MDIAASQPVILHYISAYARVMSKISGIACNSTYVRSTSILTFFSTQLLGKGQQLKATKLIKARRRAHQAFHPVRGDKGMEGCFSNGEPFLSFYSHFLHARRELYVAMQYRGGGRLFPSYLSTYNYLSSIC